MALPELDVARARAWCAALAAADGRVACHVDERSLTIVEENPPWDGGGEWTRNPVARLRYTASRREWTLYCISGNGGFRRYDLLDPAPSVVPLLAEIERDPTAIFWG